MNYKFRKRPVEIEAFQMTLERRWNNNDWPYWLNEAWQADKHQFGAFYCKNDPGEDITPVYIKTLEGIMRVTFGDYIIRGVQGELYACKPEIFAKTYEEVL